MNKNMVISMFVESVVDGFRGDYRFLSNFHPSVIDGIYPTAEHYYQYQKLNMDKVPMDVMRLLLEMTPGQVKREVRCLIDACSPLIKPEAFKSHPDHDSGRLDWMYDTVMKKFSQNEDLAKMLIDSENKYLIESNNWGDTFFGVCDGEGSNHLGIILMYVRDEIKRGES